MGPASEAPGALEGVRQLLNTRWNPRRGQPDEDTLDQAVADPAEWARRLGDLPRPAGPGDVDELRAVRDDLRAALRCGVEVLNPWLRRYPVHVTLCPDTTLAYEPADQTAPATLMAVVVNAVAARTWPRLKACRECAWVFYDHSRNATRAWCGMAVPGPNGRNCGSAAKMRAYRVRGMS